jgi:hypothetical protein
MDENRQFVRRLLRGATGQIEETAVHGLGEPRQTAG